MYLVGMSCVGKTTIGKILAEKIGYQFFDLDVEIQKYYNATITTIQNECFNMNEYRDKASVVLDKLFANNNNAIIAGTPSGLKFAYLSVYKKHKSTTELYSVHIQDTMENILERLKFFDKESNPIEVELNERQKQVYLKELRADYNYFKESYKKADFTIDISNLSLDVVPDQVLSELRRYLSI